MTHRFKTRLEQAHERGNYEALLALVPYAKLIGIECTRQGDELLFRLPANKDNIG
ncbi:MAG: PaaI family thioesterase, partial [Cytophagaceae bacterium]